MACGSRNPRSVAPLPAKLAGLLREAKWLALVAAAGYLLLILLTHHATDPGLSRSATAAVVQNAGGRVGAWLSDLLLYAVRLVRVLVGGACASTPSSAATGGSRTATRSKRGR